MTLNSEGILISLNPFNNTDCIARIFTRDYGIMVGVLRGAMFRKKNPFLIGQFGCVSWNARLESQLGVFHWESIKNLSVNSMFDSKLLALMNSMFSLINLLLPEREVYTTLYVYTLNALIDLCPDKYLQWEICLLKELGYALDLTVCAGCGKKTDLNYLSPKTYRAVCAECAVPYMDKLYKLPITLNTTLHLLEHICMAQDVNIPKARLII